MTVSQLDVQTRLLIVEDDDADAHLLEEQLLDSGEAFTSQRVRTIAEALERPVRADCILVDLGLPDAVGLTALQRLRAHAPDVAIIVVTGLADRSRAIDSMAEGAQDYLIKGQEDGPGLARAIRYAIERRRAEHDRLLLLVSHQREQENARLARGLLPQLDLDGPVSVATRYRPGADALLGGDFYDAILPGDGCLRAVIGDVCGHGPAEAAVGVALRIAWRTMTLAGAPAEEALGTMEQVLLRERDEREPFATVCDVTLDLATRQLTVRRHGHPPPLLVAPEVDWLDVGQPVPPLGALGSHVPAPPATVELPPGWSFILLTDGLFEGRAEDGRLGGDRLRGLVERFAAGGRTESLLDAVIATVEKLNGGGLDDDLALLWLSDAG